MRVLVTGDRYYKHRHIVRALLGAVTFNEEGDIFVLDGACPYGGADQMAFEWGGEGEGIFHERFPAKQPNAREFHARNQKMVDSGADVFLAFKDTFDHSLSKGGTDDTVRRCVAAGIPGFIVSAA